MTAVLNTILLILAGICLLGALYFLIAGIVARTDVPETSYGLDRQKARQAAFIAFLRSVFLFFLALIIFAILGIGSLSDDEANATGSETDTQGTPLVTTRPTEPAAESLTPQATTVSPTSPVPTLTATVTSTPIPTETPVIVIAVVNSPNGLWLREKPGGDQQLELIADGAEVTVLDGNEIIDDQEWQQVLTQTGQEGWVAVAYIILP